MKILRNIALVTLAFYSASIVAMGGQTIKSLKAKAQNQIDIAGKQLANEMFRFVSNPAETPRFSDVYLQEEETTKMLLESYRAQLDKILTTTNVGGNLLALSDLQDLRSMLDSEEFQETVAKSAKAFYKAMILPRVQQEFAGFNAKQVEDLAQEKIRSVMAVLATTRQAAQNALPLQKRAYALLDAALVLTRRMYSDYIEAIESAPHTEASRKMSEEIEAREEARNAAIESKLNSWAQ